jgi:hypothetical protein
MEDTAEKAKLREKAIAMQKKVKMEKNTEQKIRLILNVITPDNFEKKFNELRGFLFGELKNREECENEEIEYLDENILQEENINTEILTVIVQNIFRKAQVEKEYTIFYGEICE